MKRAARMAIVMILTLTACSSDQTTTPTSVAPAPASIVEPPFNGTVAVGGQDFKTFTVTKFGSITVTLTAASPPSTIWMGLGVGIPDASSTVCSLLTNGSTNTQAGVNPQLSGTLNPGTYCVQVRDIGNAASTITYSVTVAHS